MRYMTAVVYLGINVIDIHTCLYYLHERTLKQHGRPLREKMTEQGIF